MLYYNDNDVTVGIKAKLIIFVRERLIIVGVV